MKQVEIRTYQSFQICKSFNEALVIIKIDNNARCGIEESVKLVNDELKEDYLDRAGIYILNLENGYYIGETNNLNRRIREHMTTRKIINITFATYKSDLDKLNREKIRDLEHLLIEFANDAGLQLDNNKNEKRKTNNDFDHRDNQKIAKWIWDNFLIVNFEDVLDAVKAQWLPNAIETPVIDNSNENNLMHNKQDVNLFNQIKNKAELPANVFVVKNIRDHTSIVPNEEIFNYIEYREVPTQGYNKTALEIFEKEYAKKALMMYLYEGKSGPKVDKILTNGRRTKGWVNSVTLAYYRIQTNRRALGALNVIGEQSAIELIEHFVNKYA